MLRLTAYSGLTIVFLFLGACGGGGGSSSGGSSLNTLDATQNNQGELSFAGDIEPILQAKCIGCHNSGDNPLAPFSLEGEDTAISYKSAIQFAVESGTMPPLANLALMDSERNKLIAWASGQPYKAGEETVRIGLVEADAWDVQPKNRDVFVDHRPEEVDCARETGWLVEEGTLEVRTEFCNYLSLAQQSLLEIEAGTEMELALSHSELNFNAPSSAHLAVSIAGSTIWESTIAIPSEGNLLKETITLPVDVGLGDPIEVHLHNHGDNAWTIHSLDVFVPADQELAFCPTFDGTFEAIQAVVFEQAGCANSLCHGEAAEGGLDLTPVNAFDNLVGVTAQGSSLALVEPKNPSESYLYHKLSAKTFPGSYAIDGSPMPSASAAISPGQLEAIRLWIEAGAPREGSVGDTLGRGEDELERLLGVCLPEAEAINTTPLPPPERNRGVQYVMPPHDVPAESEREICFATYYDFRDEIPPEYMDAERENFYINGSKLREDPFTHHNVFFYAPLDADQYAAPEFGDWSCIGGDQDGASCVPGDAQACGSEGVCRSEIKNSLACRGFGPKVNPPEDALGGDAEDGSDEAVFGTLRNIYGTINGLEGFYEEIPTHGIFYWNSHAFNLTTEDGVHHVWRNFYFADDRRFKAENVTYVNEIYAATGTPPFEKRTVCRDFTFNQGDGLLLLSSHTHKRGERFYISIKGGEQIYETFTYDEPLIKNYSPHIVFNSEDPAERTLEYCATYNNGINADGSPNIETVTRLSRRPDNGGTCQPIACVAGKVGAPCGGADDDAACDSTPGAGDGWCDACAITTGVSSDDEMFVLIGEKLPNYDAEMEK